MYGLKLNVRLFKTVYTVTSIIIIIFFIIIIIIMIIIKTIGHSIDMSIFHEGLNIKLT